MLSEVMATRRLTRREKQQITRKAILRSASTLFARQGYEGTSMEEIARHAGLTQGAIYSNFKGKADLWDELCEQMSRTLQFEDIFHGDRPLEDELRTLGILAARLLREAPKTDLLLDHEFHLFLMRHSRARAKAVRELREGDAAAGRQLEELAERSGRELPMTGERMALLLSVIARGLLHFSMLDPEKIDEKFCADAFALLAGCDDATPRSSGEAGGSSRRERPGSRRRSTRARPTPA